MRVSSKQKRHKGKSRTGRGKRAKTSPRAAGGNNFAAHHSASGWPAATVTGASSFSKTLQRGAESKCLWSLPQEEHRRECSQKRELQRHSHYQSQRQRGEKKQELIDTQAREDDAVTTRVFLRVNVPGSRFPFFFYRGGSQ